VLGQDTLTVIVALSQPLCGAWRLSECANVRSRACFCFSKSECRISCYL